VLVETTSDAWSIRRRDGSVTDVAVASIQAGRIVPPGRAAQVSVVDIERIAMQGWRALEMDELGEWQLRAGGGFTGRANSALALGDPGLPVDNALDRVEGWYAVRDLPIRIQLVDRDQPVGVEAALDRRGWTTSPVVNAMTAELGHVLRAVPGSSDLELRLDAEPDEQWLGCYRDDGTELPPVARDILINHPVAIFASLRDGDRCVAIARGVVDGRWAGVHAVEVTPSYRGQGLGAYATAAAMRWCGQRGARMSYLQVSADNTPAVQLYGRLNYAVHHHYVYRERPRLDTRS
jgi:GNAT superfamily N-acetyltransferase